VTKVMAVLDQSTGLLLEVLPYFAAGVLLAGFLQAAGGKLRFAGFLSRSPFAVLAGALIGCVVPVCSCGVVPVALGLLAGGVAPGPVFAFLAAAPMVNPASFVMTAGVMGYKLALGRFLGALFLGAAVGFLMGALLKSEDILAPRRCACSCGGKSAPQAAPERSRFDTFFRAWFLGSRLFVTLLPYVASGIVLGGVLGAFLSPSFVARTLTGPWAIPFAALAGVPLYLCSCAEVPVALSLVRNGLEPSAVLTFLIAGPGVSVFSLALLASFLRPRWIVLYAGTFLLGSTIVGFLWRIVAA